MSRLSVASLTGGLLVAKGTAQPTCFPLYEVAGADARPQPVEPAPPAAHSRLTLRIDPVRHRRLRLAAAQFGQSGQAILVAALDHYLDEVVPARLGTPCPCLQEGAATAMLRRLP